ncbi:MAG: hypothetical protein GY795_11480 [Desulfobacterales bacterium]|nr:hypothetical protein [Desulfobacterales bacterium]
MEGLKIIRNGKLLKTKWVYNEDKGEGIYLTEDVTDNALKLLFEDCTLDEGVRLKDIFLLIKQNMELFNIIIGYWVEKIVEEGLLPCREKDNELDYLELYWITVYNEKEEEFLGNTLPAFHGVGIINDRITYYDLCVTPANEIAELPLKLCKEFTISNFVDDKVVKYKGPYFSLGQILFAIIWELSWFGSPSKREIKKQELFPPMTENL